MFFNEDGNHDDEEDDNEEGEFLAHSSAQVEQHE